MRNIETWLCWMLVCAFVLVGANTVSGQSTSISVGNWSFETTGTVVSAGVWYQLPAGGAWVDGFAGSPYEILDLTGDSTHFPSYNVGPGGARVLNLATTTPMTQDLGYMVSAGDRIAVSFAIGDSATQTPGNVRVAVLVGGVINDSAIVTNTAPSGWFTQAQTLLIATNSGNLSIRFTNVSANNWLDMIDVSVVPPNQIPVGNFSFETEGTYTGWGWRELATLGSWQKAFTYAYQIYDTSENTSHFTSVPEGNNVLLLRNASPITQNLGYTISSGSRVTIDYSLGVSRVPGNNPGNIKVAILVDGVTNDSAIVTNTATAGAFVSMQSTLTATNSGNLSLSFAHVSNDNWLDNVNVQVPKPMPMGTLISIY